MNICGFTGATSLQYNVRRGLPQELRSGPEYSTKAQHVNRITVDLFAKIPTKLWRMAPLLYPEIKKHAPMETRMRPA